MSLTTLMFRSMLRLLTLLICEPATSIPTLLYYSGLLPHNMVLLRMVRHELLEQENYLFRLLISLMSCFL
ncbi:transmembrane protein, putative [Medicago truncatula]|uniref:Transmembrane protein, putative n=1 Tax=Medicago truncatula TaxID=3880 RepID=G8A2I1_MEDTR|nr:transmembrane protein, putative [Medicago truncatula]